MVTCLADELASIVRRLRPTAPALPPGPPNGLVEAVVDGRMVYRLDRTCGICAGVGETRDGFCECLGLRRLAERLTRAGLPAPDGRPLPWESKRLVPVEPTLHLDMPRLAAALGVNAEHVDAMAEKLATGEPRSLLVYGANAAGKTTFVGVLARAWAARGASVKWWGWPGMLSALREAQRGAEGAYSAFVDRLVSPGPDVLVLDEVGPDNGSTFVATVGEAIIKTRLERGAVTVLVTNESPEALAVTLGDRVQSRIARLVKPVPFGVAAKPGGGRR